MDTGEIKEASDAHNPREDFHSPPLLSVGPESATERGVLGQLCCVGCR